MLDAPRIHLEKPNPQSSRPPERVNTGGPEAGDLEPPEEREEAQGYWEEDRAYWRVFSDYNLVVACIPTSFAVAVLVARVVWMGGVPVIGDGATLGAVFTLFYGQIRAFMTNDEQFRFGAVPVGLAVPLALVYWRYARPAGTGAAPGACGG